MQFGRVLAFATVVVAAPAITKLEDRQVVSGSGSGTVITPSTITLPAPTGTGTPPVVALNSGIASSLNTLAANAGSSLLTIGGSAVSFANSASSVVSFANTAASNAASLVVNDVNGAIANALAVTASLTPVENAALLALSGLLKDILTTLKQAKNTVVQVDSNTLSAVNLLIKNVQAAHLDQIANVVVSSTVSGVGSALQGEAAASKDLLNKLSAALQAVVAAAQPFATPLKNIQTSLTANVIANTVPLLDVYNALAMFVGSLPGAANPILVV